MIAAWAIPELRRRLLFVFAMFGVYIFGLHIPLPGVNHDKLFERSSTIAAAAAF